MPLLQQFSSSLKSMPHYRAIHSFAHASRSYYGDLTFHSTPFFSPGCPHTKADFSYHCAWSEFYLELHMLLQPTLKAWCWCLASLGPLTIKRGAILSPHGLLWASEVKRQKCEIMNECLAVYWRFPSTQLKWECAPDAIQASIFKEKRGWLCLLEWPH